MQPSLQMATLLLFIGLFLLVLELFIPSAGMLFICATLCILGCVVVAFLVDATYGAGFLILVLVLAMILPSVGFQLWKRSPIGRRMFLTVPSPAGAGGDDEEDGGFRYESLRGEVGKTLTPLRPSGMTDFDGRRIDTVSEGVMIDRGELVRVVDVQGRRVVVRLLESPDGDLNV